MRVALCLCFDRFCYCGPTLNFWLLFFRGPTVFDAIILAIKLDLQSTYDASSDQSLGNNRNKTTIFGLMNVM
ncbi:hypothetical protein DER46DRAFT_582767 [Fusarium sp. MPI-SDFR-AT-0072]|nr:hypothetical protein DER46DRAFT_582767 [Fusarium sp. MPI-SDFR-AT-0072]